MGRQRTAAAMTVALVATLFTATGAAAQWLEGDPPARFETAAPQAEWPAFSAAWSHPATIAWRVGPASPGGPAAAAATAQRSEHGFGAALGIEAAGGFLGSLAGLGLGVLVFDPDDCNNEDLECLLKDAAGVMLVGAAGSAGGAYAVGRWQDTRPSLLGAVVGSLGGLAAGLGLDHLLAEDVDLIRDEGVRLVIYSATQGLVTALGSRIGDALRP